MSVRLFIAGMEAELAEGAEVAITKQTANILQLDKRKLDFSNRITLPPTTTNIAIMQNLGVNGNNSERPYKYASARLEINGITYADNLVSIVDDLGGNGYELRLLGNPFDAFQQMKGKQLRDVVDYFVDGGVHQLDIDSWKVLQNASGGYTYPLISQLRPFPAFPKTRLYIDLCYPAFFTRDLLDKLLSQYFTNLTGNVFSSDLYSHDLTFAADTENQVWKDYEKVIVDKQNDVSFGFAPVLSSIWFGFVFIPEQDNKQTCLFYSQSVDPDAFKFEGTGITVFESPANRKFKLKLNTQFTIGTLSSGQRYRLEAYLRPRGNVNINPLSDTRVAESEWYATAGTYTIESELDLFQRVDEGLYFVYKTELATTFVDIIIRNFTFTIEPERQSIFGEKLMNPKLLLPDCTEFDYFIDQVKRFGLIFQTYYDGTIRLESFKDVLSGMFGAVDWSNKLVQVNKTSFELGKYGKTTYIQYKGDRDGLLLAGYNGWGFWIYDNDRYDVENVAVESKGKAVSQLLAHLQPPFENALNVGGYELNDNTDVILTQEKELVYGRLNQNADFAANYALWLLNNGAFTGNTGQVLQPFEFAANVSLAELGSHITDYYGNLIDSLERPVVREVEVYLSEVDFYNLDFFKLVYLEQFQKYHYLLSVENYIPGKTVKAKLLEVKGTLDVRRCCDYSVEGIPPLTSNCVRVILTEEFNYSGEDAAMIEISADVQDGTAPSAHVFFSISYFDLEQPTISQLLQDIINDFDDKDGRYILTTGSNWYQICDLESDIFGDFQGVFQGNFPNGQTPNIAFITTGNVEIIQGNPVNGYYFVVRINEESSLIFQVRINGTWTDVTDEVIDGTWQRLNECTDVITEWRIIDSEENVIDSEQVTANCTF